MFTPLEYAGGTVTYTATGCTGSTVTAIPCNSLNRLNQVSRTGLAAERYVYDDVGRMIRKNHKKR